MTIVSIIIPTHNRCDLLAKHLRALTVQDFPLADLEVIVVVDGCIDQTAEMLQAYQPPYVFDFVELPGEGAAIARNKGAELAQSSLLLFIDDDIEPSPQLVSAHVNAHQGDNNRVVLGYLPPIIQQSKGFFPPLLRSWWEAMFIPLRQKGYRYSYRNLLSGNFSISASLFRNVGKFNPDFKCQEDYELGIRLIYAKADFIFAADAVGYHHEMTDLNRSLQRKYMEGKASVWLGRKYPELIGVLPILSSLNTEMTNFRPIVLNLILKSPALSDLLANGLRYWMDVLECLGARIHWQRLLDQLLRYWFLRGVASIIPTRLELVEFLESQSRPRQLKAKGLELEIQLEDGLIAAEEKIDAYRPSGIRIYYESYFVGYIASQPGYEALRSEHLRPMLATTFSYPLLQILAFKGVLSKAAIFSL